MIDMAKALQRSLSSLGQGKVWLYILGPGLAAIVFMAGVSAVFLDRLIARFLEQAPMDWLGEWGMTWLARTLAMLAGWLAILSASYLVAMLLTAMFVLPLMLDHVAKKDYPDLARLGKDSFVASAWNGVWAIALFVAGWVATLPLWLIPGLGAILPLFWMGWLNRRTFAHDALSAHATSDEARALRRNESLPLFILGLIMAAMTHVPVAGLFAPSLAALAYTHFCLEALRRSRAEN
jgi:uncharacterized protein involved in cysteine biosynthesis